MKRVVRTLMIVVILSGLLAGRPVVVHAFPPLPSSFYGVVKLNGANLGDGTLMEAIINEQVFASTITQTYQGDSVFSLDIPGDDLTSEGVEGGKEGDTIYFRVAGILADQTGVWHSGTNVSLNLATSSTSTPLPPLPSRTPLPTQTALAGLPTQVPPTLTPIAAVPTQVPPMQTSVPTPQTTAGAASPPPAAATASLETPSAAAVPQETPPAATRSPETPAATTGPQEIRPAAGAPTLPSPTDAPPSATWGVASRPILAMRTEAASSTGEPETGREGESPWSLWIGASLIGFALLLATLLYVSKQKRTTNE